MRSPYRENDNTPPAPVLDLRWRHRVAVGAGWLATFLLGRFAVLFLASLGLLPALGTLAADIGVVVGTWMLTAPGPRCRADALGWSMRATVAGYLGASAVGHFATGLDVVRFVCAVLALGTGMAYLARLFRVAGADRHARRARLLLVPLGLTVVLIYVTSLLWPGSFLGVALTYSVVTVVAGVLKDLRRTLLPIEHQWWFDAEMEPPGEWVSLLVHRDKQAEVLCIDETLGWFDSEDEATEWLQGSGYVPATCALEERLVSEVPTDPTTAPRGRNPQSTHWHRLRSTLREG